MLSTQLCTAVMSLWSSCAHKKKFCANYLFTETQLVVHNKDWSFVLTEPGLRVKLLGRAVAGGIARLGHESAGRNPLTTI